MQAWRTPREPDPMQHMLYFRHNLAMT